MRCSRRCGVTLYSYDNGHFMAYTSSERLKPPTFSSRRRLLVTVLSYTRSLPRLIYAPNYAPVARRCNRRGLAKPDQGGKQETNGGKLAFIRAVQAFTCHGEYYPAIFLIRLAIRSAPSPVWEKAFIVMRFARNITGLSNNRN